MADTTSRYDRLNRRTPVVPFRLPSRQHHEQLKRAALAEGVTVSRFIRLAVAERLSKAAAPST